MKKRPDHILAIANTLGYCQGVEKLLAIAVPPRAQFLRIIVHELSRVSGHLYELATQAVEVEDMTVFLYCFREHKIIHDHLADICGPGPLTGYVCLGGVRQDITPAIRVRLEQCITGLTTFLEEYEALIRRKKTEKHPNSVRRVASKKGEALYLTKTLPGKTGATHTIRRYTPQTPGDRIDSESPQGQTSNAYATYRSRMEELKQSTYILSQCTEKLPSGPTLGSNAPVTVPAETPARKGHMDKQRKKQPKKFIANHPLSLERGGVMAETLSP